MAELWYNIAETFSTINWRDVLDILIMTFLIYQGIKLVRETRAAQLVKGIALLLVLYLPVSYTHLDVYKRQGRKCRACRGARLSARGGGSETHL